MKLSTTRILLILAGTIAIAAPAVAQQKHAQTRKGFWFNGGLGWGSLGCDGCGDRTGGVSGGLSLGGTLSSRVLLGVGTTGWSRSEGGATLTVGTLDARIRLYPSPTGGFFLTGGIGFGNINAAVAGFGSGGETGGGAVLGLGYDIRVGPMLSVTPFWNVFGIKTENSEANVAQIGVSITTH